MTPGENNYGQISGNARVAIGIAAFLGIAIILLWTEHKAHILGALPFVLLAICPLIHIFLHGGHGHGSGSGHSHSSNDEVSSKSHMNGGVS